MKTLKRTPRELKKSEVVNEDGEIRFISLSLTGIRSMFGWRSLSFLIGSTALCIIFGLMTIGAYPTVGKTIFYLIPPCWLLWLIWSLNIVSFYSKGIIISSKHDMIVIPAFRDDSLLDFFLRIFPKRHKSKLSEIKKLHSSEKEKELKKSDRIDYKTIYELSVLGDFGSRIIEFDRRQKREEARSALKDMGSKVGIKIEDELDMIG